MIMPKTLKAHMDYSVTVCQVLEQAWFSYTNLYLKIHPRELRTEYHYSNVRMLR